ncbi:MAG: ankyrin repeat domain-containing protein [Boseongicola sp.]|nr:ankyrin repeat domain-containing protein [Boseongicola sp.]
MRLFHAAAVASPVMKRIRAARLPGRGGSLAATLRRIQSQARRLVAAAGRIRERGQHARPSTASAGPACRQSSADPGEPAATRPAAWHLTESDAVNTITSSRLDIACFMEMTRKSPPVCFGRFHLLEGWALSLGLALERPNRNTCHVRGRVGDGTVEAGFSQLWVRAGYEGYRRSFLEFHRDQCESFPDDLRNVDADHVVSRSRIPQDAWVQLFPVEAAANRRYGSAFERRFPEVGPETRQLDLSPLTAFKLFCGRVPADVCELDRAMEHVRGHFRQEVPEVSAFCDRIERAVRCHMDGDVEGSRRHDVPASGEARASAADGIAAALGRLMSSGTPLHYAAEKGNAALASVLMYQEEDPDARLDDGGTPLHYAANFGHAGVVQRLIDAGADPDATRGRGTTPLHLASWRGHPSAAAALVAGGADVDRVLDSGGSALHLAVQEGHAKVVAALLKAGADPDIRRLDGCAPLHLAACLDRRRISRILLRHGADPDAARSCGTTPLHFAALHGHPSPAAALVAGGADVDHVPESGGSALHLAVQEGHAKVVAALLKAGADPNVRRFDGWTPLHLAACLDRRRISRLLLRHGADPRSAHDDGRTPFDLAGPRWRASFSGQVPGSQGQAGRGP